MPLITKGFQSVRLRQLHFLKHKDEFGCTTPEEYEVLADTFLTQPKQGWMKECDCTTSDDTIRYDTRSQEFGMLWDGYIVTYFKVSGSRRDAELYFEKQCSDCGGEIR
jgi:hypothetical protein